MNEHDLKITIEATLLAAGRPVTTQQLLDLFDERERPSTEQLQAALEQLANDYAERGIEVIEVASGWRIQIRQRCIEVVSRLWQERPSKYSRALLETLALVAYRQPITRSEIEEIRGVSISSTIMRTLQERNWIRVVGHREVPGRPELLGTTRDFLDYFGLKSLDQLPTLAELRDVETIGVQLELPNGEAAEGAATEGAETAEGERAEDVTADDEAANDQAVEATSEAGALESEAAAAEAEAPASDEIAEEQSTEETIAASEEAVDEDQVESVAADEAEVAATTAEDATADVAADDVIEEDAIDDDIDAVADAGDDPELSADADEDDEDVKPTLVASSEDDATRRFDEPPRED